MSVSAITRRTPPGLRLPSDRLHPLRLSRGHSHDSSLRCLLQCRCQFRQRADLRRCRLPPVGGGHMVWSQHQVAATARRRDTGNLLDGSPTATINSRCRLGRRRGGLGRLGRRAIRRHCLIWLQQAAGVALVRWSPFPFCALASLPSALTFPSLPSLLCPLPGASVTASPPQCTRRSGRPAAPLGRATPAAPGSGS